MPDRPEWEGQVSGDARTNHARHDPHQIRDGIVAIVEGFSIEHLYQVRIIDPEDPQLTIVKIGEICRPVHFLSGYSL